MKEKKSTKAMVYLGALLLPMVVMLAILKAGGFYPFGEKSLFIMDMKGQYLEFYASLRNMGSGDDSIFFSWSRSMGGNYLGLFAYYVASPLSFLTLLFPIRKLPDAIVLLTVLKVGLCGCSFAGYASYLWNRSYAKRDKQESGTAKSSQTGYRLGSWMILPLSICYALISYNMVYSLCLMWLDGVILLPMVLLGVEKILDGKKGLHYMLALAALFICNYYTGYMVGIFTAIYVVYRVLCQISAGNIREYMIKVARFAGTTILAFGLSAPLVLPVAKDLMQGKLATATYMPDTKTNFVFLMLFGKLKNGVYDSITNSGLPAIYCGYLAIALALVFFVMKKISLREKIGAGVILVLLSLSFYFIKWDIVWHGFQYPTWFPYRYAFVASFFILYMAVRCLSVVPWGQLQKRNVPQMSMLAGVAVLFVIICIEMGINGKAMLQGLDGEFGYGTVAEYEAFIDKTQPLVEDIQKRDDGFYRINQGYEYSKNDAMLLGYNGMTHYSSTFNAAVNALTPKLGIAQAHIWNSGYGSNPLLDGLWGVKYILEDGQVPTYQYLAIEDGIESEATAYLNKVCLPIAYGAPADTLSPDLSSADPYANQNTLLNTIADVDQSYFKGIEYTTAQDGNNWSYTFTATSDENPVYLYMKSDATSWADVYVNGNKIGNYFSTETSCSLYLGTFVKGDQVTVQVVPADAITINYAMIDELDIESLYAVMTPLMANGMDVTSHGHGKLQGKINVGEGQKIITSIPFSEGWTVKLDGKEVEKEKFADTFLAVEADAGKHDIVFSYVSPGFDAGVSLCALAVLIAIGYLVPIATWKSLWYQMKTGKRKETTVHTVVTK